MLALTFTRRVSQRFTNFILHVPVKKETDLEILEQQIIYKKLADLETLSRTTKFSRSEIQKMYRGFKQRCPSGSATEEVLKEIYAELFPHGDPSVYAHLVFVTLDRNKTGKITFEDYLNGLSLMARGNIKEKLRWIFSLYDTNSDGVITLSDLKYVVSAIYRMLGRHTFPPHDEESPGEHAKLIFEKFSHDEEGRVNLDEFVSACLKDRALIRSISALDTVI